MAVKRRISANCFYLREKTSSSWIIQMLIGVLYFVQFIIEVWLHFEAFFFQVVDYLDID